MSKKLSVFYDKVPSFVWGYVGVGIPVISMFITALIYRDPLDSRFSIFNMFVSELGERAVSEVAWLFNWGLILGAIPLLLFMLGLGLKYKSIFGWICTAGGIFCSISAFFVGIFPMDFDSSLYMTGHVISAMSFFYGGMATVFLFSILIFIDKKKILPRWLGVFGIVVAIIFALFLFLPEGALDDIMIRPRDPFLLLAFLEWLVVFAIFAWIATISITINVQRNRMKKLESADTI
jgi:hypothetical protein